MPSEVESDGDPEDPLSDSESTDKSGNKRKKKKSTKRRKKAKADDSMEENTQAEIDPAKLQLTEEEKKKRADLLWADFKKDTNVKRKTADNESTNGDCSSSSTSNELKSDEDKLKSAESSVKSSRPIHQEKVKIKQLFEFAGEAVEVEKEVAADSLEARLYNKKETEEKLEILTTESNSNVHESSLNNSTTTVRSKFPVATRGRGGLKGIGSVLSQLGKKAKVSTLEKSKLDWEKFKKEEKIDDELKAYNKGRDGYLDRQDFLQRADLRRFEIEKDIRTIERNKRMNNV